MTRLFDSFRMRRRAFRSTISRRRILTTGRIVSVNAAVPRNVPPPLPQHPIALHLPRKIHPNSAHSYLASRQGFIFLHIHQSNPTVFHYSSDGVNLPDLVLATPVEQTRINEHAHLITSAHACLPNASAYTTLSTYLSAEVKPHIQSRFVR